MWFNSIPFLLFALVFFALWPLMKKQNQSRWSFLVIMSFIFYGWWDWRFLFLILGSGLIDYFCGLAIVNSKDKKRTYLVLSLLGNIGSLSVFKYSEFLAENIELISSSVGLKLNLVNNIPEFALITPIGISFFTFQSMSYTIDIYRGRLKPTKSVLHFFSYLVMFPQLVAGPIVRAKDLLKQLTENRVASDLQKWHAIKLIAFGLFQKVVIADNLGSFVNAAYGGNTIYDGSVYWFFVLVAFSFQIYCDFSGYSLMARGLAKFMGFHFKMNFNHPYLAVGFKDFWRRWHISLSTWFRDYVYIPLGGSRSGIVLAMIFAVLTMMISGIWHGPAWTFMLWGLAHGLFLVFERIIKWEKWLNKTIVRGLTFLLVLLAWNLFRSDDLNQAVEVYSELSSFSFNMSFVDKNVVPIIFISLGFLIEFVVFIRKSNWQLFKVYNKLNLDIAVVTISIVLSIYLRGAASEFIYFQF